MYMHEKLLGNIFNYGMCKINKTRIQSRKVFLFWTQGMIILDLDLRYLRVQQLL